MSSFFILQYDIMSAEEKQAAAKQIFVFLAVAGRCGADSDDGKWSVYAV